MTISDQEATTLKMPVADAKAWEKARHIPELDGLRGLAITMVLAFHYISLASKDNYLLLFISNAARSLWFGVDLFFVLSGFLITGILFDAKGSPSFFKTFYVRRILRIFPLYFGVLIFIFWVLPALLSVGSIADQRLMQNQEWLWFYGTNILIARDGYWPFIGDRVWMHHLWSLAVEEHFYLLWPLVVFLCDRKTLRCVCVGCALAALIIRVVMIVMQVNPLACYVLTPCRLDSLAMGGFLSLIIREKPVDDAFRKSAILIVIASSIILACIFIWRNGLQAEDKIMCSVGYSILAFWSLGMLMSALSLSPTNILRRTLRLKGIRVFGKYSYGIYIYHVLFQPSFERLFATKILQQYLHSYLISGIVHLTLAVSASFAVAFASWHIYEKHFLKLKWSFSYQQAV